MRQHARNGLRAASVDRYLDELGAVVSAAVANNIDPVDAINAFMEAKSQRYTLAATKEAQKWETLKLVAEVTAGGLLLVALFSLVLVLLAIERTLATCAASTLEVSSQSQTLRGQRHDKDRKAFRTLRRLSSGSRCRLCDRRLRQERRSWKSGSVDQAVSGLSAGRNFRRRSPTLVQPIGRCTKWQRICCPNTESVPDGLCPL